MSVPSKVWSVALPVGFSERQKLVGGKLVERMGLIIRGNDQYPHLEVQGQSLGLFDHRPGFVALTYPVNAIDNRQHRSRDGKNYRRQ
jgi:hypothetical protein